MYNLNLQELKEFLDEKHDLYNRPSFIETDPIQIPHRYSLPEDIEISAFLTATLAWGKRANIIRSANNLMKLLDNDPYNFVVHASSKERASLATFKHRTFQGVDCVFFIDALHNIYKNHGGLKQIFEYKILESGKIDDALSHFRKVFFSIPYPERTTKHIADIEKNSAAKRLNLFLMWMVRNDNRGVHFGLWKGISPAQLYLPLDLHTGNIGRKLQLIHRKQNDWSAVQEITTNLRLFDANDPVKYDFALFGLGISENF